MCPGFPRTFGKCMCVMIGRHGLQLPFDPYVSKFLRIILLSYQYLSRTRSSDDAFEFTHANVSGSQTSANNLKQGVETPRIVQ